VKRRSILLSNRQARDQNIHGKKVLFLYIHISICFPNIFQKCFKIKTQKTPVDITLITILKATACHCKIPSQVTNMSVRFICPKVTVYVSVLFYRCILLVAQTLSFLLRLCFVISFYTTLEIVTKAKKD
jgi:hypothetical protein